MAVILFLALMFFLYSISSGDRALFPRCRPPRTDW